MTHEEMTVHRALAELKVIDSRINNAISGATFVCSNKHSNEKIGGVAIADVREKMKADYAKIIDLTNRRNAIKRAVVLSNAKVTVNIGNVTYTVAEAIDMKNHGMDMKSILREQIDYQYRKAQNDLIANTGDPLEKRAEQYVLSVIQAQPKDSKMSVDSDSMQALRKDYIKNNAYDLIDPLNVADVLAKLVEEIESFNTEVDSALSVSNALSVIQIDY